MVAIAVATFAANAQDLNFGPLVGLDFVAINNSVDPEPEGVEVENVSGFGFHLGGFGQYVLSDQISIQADLQYQFRRITDEFDTQIVIEQEVVDGTVDQTATDHFIQIPIMVQYNVSESFGVEVGPTLGFLVGSSLSNTTSYTLNGNSVETETEITGSDATEGRNGFEFGLGVGANYNVNESLGIGLRYVLALTDTAEETEIAGTTSNSRYNLVQLTARYTLGG